MIRLLSFIISLFTWGTVNLVTVDYTKDIYAPIAELNNHSLSDVFENRNILMPDLTDKEYLDDGEYRLYGDNINYFNYNFITGIYTLNGELNILAYISFYKDIYFYEFVYSFYYESGTYIGNNFNLNYWNTSNVGTSGILNVKYDNKSVVGTDLKTIYFIFTDRTFDNYKFKLQLEKGSITIPYQVPTKGPYSEIDLSTLGLTTEQIDYYYQQYLDNKDNPPHERFEVNVNDLTITDLVILMSFSFGYVIVFLVIRKVVKKK